MLFFADPLQVIEVNIKERQKVTINDFLANSDLMILFDEDGVSSGKRASLQINRFPIPTIFFGAMSLDTGSKVLMHRFQKAMIAGWRYQLKDPSEQAVEDFRSFFVIKNFSTGNNRESYSSDEWRKISSENTEALADEFSKLLDEAQTEEDIQTFLSHHPELICPDYIKCIPKFSLGNDYVTDFVFLIQGQEGLEYVFVEIESTNKDIFTTQGHVSSKFTQAKDQLLNWEKWLDENVHYVRTKLPDLYRPRFQLIMGRDEMIKRAQREKLRLEFESSTRIFCTYDDLLSRFKQIVKHLLDSQ